MEEHEARAAALRSNSIGLLARRRESEEEWRSLSFSCSRPNKAESEERETDGGREGGPWGASINDVRKIFGFLIPSPLVRIWN